MKLNNYSADAYKKLAASSEESETSAEQKDNLNVKSAPASRALKEGGLLKTGKETYHDSKEDSVFRRVAKFLVLIGIDEAAKIIPHLSPEQTEKIIPELASIKKVESEEAKEILDEFSSLVEKSRETGGVNTARAILEKAFGGEKAGEVLEKAVPFKNGKPFEYLSEANSEKISALLKDESAPVRALVCSHLKPKVAAEFIQNLKDDEKKEVIVRLAKLKDMDPVVVSKIDEAMQKKVNALVTQESNSIDGKNILAQILKKMDASAEEKIISGLSESDPELGIELRERLFTVSDILNADDRFIQKKLQTMEDREIVYLIAGKDGAFREKILNDVSANRRKMILDEEERCRPFLKADVEKATAQFFSYMRRSYEDAKLIIKNRDEDLYV